MPQKHRFNTQMPDAALVGSVGGLLAQHGLRLMLAESMTGGAVVAALSVEEHAREYLLGGVVCYSDEVKENNLGVSRSLLDEYGGVSAEVTEALVQGLERHYPPADIRVAITGFAFDSPACTSENPVGTVFIHLRFGSIDVAQKYHLKGDPYEIVAETVTLVLLLLEDRIHQLEE